MQFRRPCRLPGVVRGGKEIRQAKCYNTPIVPLFSSKFDHNPLFSIYFFCLAQQVFQIARACGKTFFLTFKAISEN
ncbi:hypothetical protein J2T55_002608 [Methylohalomonas lacus]|uniref:Uncharacterized protein n=1 Tax=Methylohalomonas lacus TaxID=398773 RepID=A0AAE3L1U7_9GAMM|nr:hypothetical protein [Methylohalomonas lacus]MCS3904569.1 hypothetical protein [Methylohalomonas lacus]